MRIEIAGKRTYRLIDRATGQRCLAGSIVVGVADAYRPVRERILDAAASQKLGNGLDPAVTMGPLISRPHRERVAGYVSAGEREGATLLVDGRNATVKSLPKGHWFGPTVFENVDPGMSIGNEEIFGPVIGLSRADSLEAAIALVHRNRYGNAVTLFTRSGAAARELDHADG